MRLQPLSKWTDASQRGVVRQFTDNPTLRQILSDVLLEVALQSSYRDDGAKITSGARLAIQTFLTLGDDKSTPYVDQFNLPEEPTTENK